MSKEIEAVFNKLFPGLPLRSDFLPLGLDESEVVSRLEITWPELHRWQKDGHFPASNGTVLTWVWKSGRKYKKLQLTQGWSPELIDAVEANVEAWRAEHGGKRTTKQRQRSRNRQIIKTLLSP